MPVEESVTRANALVTHACMTADKEHPLRGRGHAAGGPIPARAAEPTSDRAFSSVNSITAVRSFTHTAWTY